MCIRLFAVAEFDPFEILWQPKNKMHESANKHLAQTRMKQNKTKKNLNRFINEIYARAIWVASQ